MSTPLHASTDHWWRYRSGAGWLPWHGGEGGVTTGGYQTALSSDRAPRRQPIGFRGAAPGLSLDERGLPRIRVRAGSSVVP